MFSGSTTKSEPSELLPLYFKTPTIAQLRRSNQIIRTGDTVSKNHADVPGIVGQYVRQPWYRIQKDGVSTSFMSCYRSVLEELTASIWLILHRRFADALNTYNKVIEIDPRNVSALVFLGSVYQLLDDPDRAIVKYHEVFDIAVSVIFKLTIVFFQALSLNPINGQAITLLNVSLDATSYVRPKEAKPMPSWMKIAFGKPQSVAARAPVSPTGADVDESSVDGSI